ncbi:hypothetical protein [Amycolatopsis cihanbeyliensis]|uniref:Uncharacterized protein n=1 Tax=Amycolatopsis cihanbeyliensis TaxID=1128664 RepID=A0A542DG25_AMYCI|nr:hypothetical protein [Amycolatopsis cihanbeyliensis]TQJ02016.1 hypothetical protein FB471_1733 [Amycolatopsis cihanbeyliensis]
MRTWNEFRAWLTSTPRGTSADGRRLGLGLATALERQRRNPTVDVEEFLRKRARETRGGFHTTASS